MFRYIALYSGASPIAGFCGSMYASSKVKAAYPPKEGNSYEPGQRVSDEKANQVVVGYFGAEGKVFETGIDPDRGLYYGDKQTAQEYALSRGAHGTPQVGVVIADYYPSIADHASPRFEGPHAPLSPEFLKRANARVICPETVTEANRISLLASVKRWWAQN